MGKQIVYEGPSSKTDPSGKFKVRDESGEMHSLKLGVPVEVPDSLAAELLEGSDRTKGHTFAAYAEKRQAAPSEASTSPPTTPPNPSGAGR